MRLKDKDMKRNNVSGVARYVALASAPIGALLLLCALLFEYDKGTNYFAVGAILPTVAILVAILSFGSGILSALLSDPKGRKTSPIAPSPLPALPSAIGFVLCAVGMLMSKTDATNILIALLLIFAAAYALFSSRGASPLLGAAPVLACALLNIYHYFDISAEMNASLKLIIQVPLLFIMIYYTCELRYLIGRPLPLLYLIFAYGAFAFSVLPILTLPVAYALGLAVRADYTACGLMLFGVSLTIFFRILHLHGDCTFPEVSDTNDCKEDVDE